MVFLKLEKLFFFTYNDFESKITYGKCKKGEDMSKIQLDKSI